MKVEVNFSYLFETKLEEDSDALNDLKWATLIVRLDEETVKTIKEME